MLMKMTSCLWRRVPGTSLFLSLSLGSVLVAHLILLTEVRLASVNHTQRHSSFMFLLPSNKTPQQNTEESLGWKSDDTCEEFNL